MQTYNFSLTFLCEPKNFDKDLCHFFKKYFFDTKSVLQWKNMLSTQLKIEGKHALDYLKKQQMVLYVHYSIDKRAMIG